MTQTLGWNDPETYWRRWARVKKRQAAQAESLAGVATGIGEHGIANTLWQLEAILREQYAKQMKYAMRERGKKEAAEDANTEQGSTPKR